MKYRQADGRLYSIRFTWIRIFFWLALARLCLKCNLYGKDAKSGHQRQRKIVEIFHFLSCQWIYIRFIQYTIHTPYISFFFLFIYLSACSEHTHDTHICPVYLHSAQPRICGVRRHCVPKLLFSVFFDAAKPPDHTMAQTHVKNHTENTQCHLRCCLCAIAPQIVCRNIYFCNMNKHAFTLYNAERRWIKSKILYCCT